jgi:hypothetical protein
MESPLGCLNQRSGKRLSELSGLAADFFWDRDFSRKMHLEELHGVGKNL